MARVLRDPDIGRAAGADADLPSFRVPDGHSPTITCPRIPDDGYQSSLSTYLLDPAQTKAFDTVCKAAGTSMAVGVYTALTMAGAACSGADDLRFISPSTPAPAPSGARRWDGSSV